MKRSCAISVRGSRSDQPVVGALGGSALQYFTITVDYRHARAVFERPGLSNIRLDERYR